MIGIVCMPPVYYRYLVDRKGFCYATRMENTELRIVYKDERFLVVQKPPGVPTVPLARDPHGPSLLTLLKHDFPETANPGGRHAHEGLVLHRLDTDTSGLVLVARDISSYRFVQESQMDGQFEKTYIAATKRMPMQNGFPPVPENWVQDSASVVTSRFRSYGKKGASVRPVTENSSYYAKEKGGSALYTTTILPWGVNGAGEQLFQCTLVRGFRHQIRCHLAWTGNPIIGDGIYGGASAEVLHLGAVSLRFHHPDSEHPVTVDWDTSPSWALRIDCC